MSKFLFVALLTGVVQIAMPEAGQAQRRGGPQQAQSDTERETQPPARGFGRGRGRFGQGGPSGQALPMSGRGHGHGGARPSPLFTALDKDKDGHLSREELSTAVEVIKTLDKDKDGVLSLAECAPAGGHGHGGPRPNPGEEAKATVETLMVFDKNKDEILTKQELPERMANLIKRADVDGDGRVTKVELTAMAKKEAAEQTPVRRGFGRGRGRFSQPFRPPSE